MKSSPRETELCHYHYDPLDQLSGHARPDTPERQRFYCKSRLATEIQGAMRFSILQQGDQLLAQQRSEGDAPDTTLLATDQQRSVLQTVKDNHPLQPIAYSPYGHRPVGSGLLSLLGFNGERPDPVTGHYLLGNGYRAFNAVLMRFNSPDSLSPFGKGGLNSYAYCAGNPINRLDPTGHSIVSTLANTLTKPLSPDTIIALYKAEHSLKTQALLPKILGNVEISNSALIEQTLKNSRIKINKNLHRFENPQEKISHAAQIETLEILATKKIQKHMNIIDDLRYNPDITLNNTINAEAYDAWGKGYKYLGYRKEMTKYRIERFKREGVAHVFHGASTSNSDPSTTSEYIRKS